MHGTEIATNKYMFNKDGRLIQVSALVYRYKDNKPYLLLITSRGTKRWIIPKGWPIPGRSLAQSALKESFEEAGVRGVVSTTAIGHYSYIKVEDLALSQKVHTNLHLLTAKEPGLLSPFAVNNYTLTPTDITTKKEVASPLNIPIHVYIFPVFYSHQEKKWPEHGQRIYEWVCPKQAAERVREPELKAILRNYSPQY
ncbi:NUDIX hydrolase [Bartonella sp. DGB2]|uniref:NUDIX hydrolase n=1 Tax=Bartonella sp. DGB2 TaxID=3388426 RepID=UPI00398FF006